ncbi:stage II sporulation protein R [Peptococcaceae bacterium]|nr:stage II sporulation protein R [Peptococcaceae bacterium]
MEDQALKMHVKNAVINAMRDKLENVSTKREALKIIDENLKYIKKVASEQVVNQGKDYEVEMLLNKNKFPIKDYGNITLAAGKYDAVKIIIREMNLNF